MARITPQGVAPTTLPAYIERLNATYRAALGQDLSVAAESPQGQLIGNEALQLTEQDEALVTLANAFALPTALGFQLDNLGSLLGIGRRSARQSLVAVTLSGDSGTSIPADSRARTTAGDTFALTAAITIGTEGTVTGTMRAVEEGPVPAEAGALTEILDLVVGWTGVTNPTAATLGRLTESDVAYRSRYARLVAHNGRSGVENIQARILAVDGVEDAIVYENDTDSDVTLQELTITARSILAIVQGGTDADVGRAILETKPVGIPTSGTESVGVLHAQGQTTTIQFSRVMLVPLSVDATIAVGDAFPSDGVTLIKQRCAQWIAGIFSALPGYFDKTGQGIGESLDVRRLDTPILSVPGHRIADGPTALLKAGDGVVLDNTSTVEYVYQATAENTAPATPTGGVTTDDFVPTGWSADPIEPTGASIYVWRSTRTQTGGAWTNSDFATPILWSTIELPDPPALNDRFTLAEDDVAVEVSFA